MQETIIHTSVKKSHHTDHDFEHGEHVITSAFKLNHGQHLYVAAAIFLHDDFA